MCSVYKVDAHERRLGSEYLGIHPVEHLSAFVVIAVARRSRKAAVAHLVVFKRRKHVGGAAVGVFVYFRRYGRKGALRFGCKSRDLVVFHFNTAFVFLFL